jgi:hypothetical protein
LPVTDQTKPPSPCFSLLCPAELISSSLAKQDKLRIQTHPRAQHDDNFMA